MTLSDQEPTLQSPDQPALRRSVGMLLLTLYGVGTILGAGIYVLVGEVAGRAGIYAPVSFVLAAFLALFSAFSYAELAARFPFSAGEAVYVEEAFHKTTLSALIGYLVLLTGMVSSATLVHGFAGYLSVFVVAPLWVMMVGTVICMGLVAAWGVKESLTLAAIMTTVEVLGLLMVIWVGGASFLENGLPAGGSAALGQFPGWAGIIGGAFIAFYAYVGFEDMVNVAEEVKDPAKTLPRAILLALAVTTLFYLVVSLVAVLVLTPDELIGSKAPLALLYQKATGNSPVVITLIGLFAVINGALIQVIMASRVLYGMGSRGWAPGIFSRVGKRTGTPLLATALVTLIILLLALWFPLVTLAGVTSFLTLLLFLLINVSLIWIKRTRLPVEGLVSYPVVIPWLGVFTIAIFLLFAVIV